MVLRPHQQKLLTKQDLLAFRVETDTNLCDYSIAANKTLKADFAIFGPCPSLPILKGLVLSLSPYSTYLYLSLSIPLSLSLSHSLSISPSPSLPTVFLVTSPRVPILGRCVPDMQYIGKVVNESFALSSEYYGFLQVIMSSIVVSTGIC